MVGKETDLAKQTQLIKEKILTALDEARASDPNYFYKNYTYEDRRFDAAYEQVQIDLFKSTADKVIAQFIQHHVSD